MPITVNKNSLIKLQKDNETLIKHLNTVIANTLGYVGEQCVNIARDKGSYIDRTGNLRSSIGYVVTDGKYIKMGEQRQFKEGADGLSKSKKLLEEYAHRHAGHMSLHVVAGMDYASYVEDIHHRDVLSFAEIEGQGMAKELLSKLL